MVAIAFDTAPQKEHVRLRLDTVLVAFRKMLDAFVSNRLRRAAAEAEHVRPRQILATLSRSISAQ